MTPNKELVEIIRNSEDFIKDYGTATGLAEAITKAGYVKRMSIEEIGTLRDKIFEFTPYLERTRGMNRQEHLKRWKAKYGDKLAYQVLDEILAQALYEAMGKGEK